MNIAPFLSFILLIYLVPVIATCFYTEGYYTHHPNIASCGDIINIALGLQLMRPLANTSANAMIRAKAVTKVVGQ